MSNKPKKFGDHCIEKIGLGKCIPLQNISKADENTYVVQTSKDSPTYNVRLLNNSELSFCECEAWRNAMLPCKQMLALFEHIEEISLDPLRSSYRNSPFLNLDEEIISTLQVQENELHGLEPEVSTEGAEKPILLEIPKKVYPKKYRASACREILNKVKSLTFVVYDGEALEKLEEQLLYIVESFGKSAPIDSGLILDPVKTVTKNKYKDQISLRKSKKSYLTGRVGMAAEK